MKADEVLDAAAAAGPTLRWEALGCEFQFEVGPQYKDPPLSDWFCKTREPSDGG